MNENGGYAAGEGPLTYGRVLREAWCMFREHHQRVALVALLLFVPPPLVAAGLEGLRESLEADPGLARGLGYVAGLLLAIATRLLGPLVYAGYLDEAVAHEYFRGHRVHGRTVLRTLPWGRLVAADVILVGSTVIGMALFVLPGLAWMTLFTRPSTTRRCGCNCSSRGWSQPSWVASWASWKWHWRLSSWPAIGDGAASESRRTTPPASLARSGMERFAALEPLYE